MTLREALEDVVPTEQKRMWGAWQRAEMSPTAPSCGTQDLVEPILLQEARERGSDVSFSTKLLSFEQDEQGVIAHVRDRVSGEERTIDAAKLCSRKP